MAAPPVQGIIEDDDEPLVGLDVPLGDAVIGEDSTFRTTNDSSDDWERRNVIERTQGSIHTRVDLMDVVHGTYDDDGDEATLMVFRFRFDPQKNSRRVIRALVNVEFLAVGDKGSAPVVDTIAPEERWSVIRTTDQESTTKSGELSAADAPLIQAGAAAKLEKTISRDVTDATTVTGSINLGTGRNSGESTVAVWNMQENKRRESGVPDSVTVAVLLRREDSAPFHARVTLEADVDFLSGLERKFRKIPLDDPVLFNPRMTSERPRKGRRYGAENLGSVDLYSLCRVRMDLEAPFVAGN
ncbi:hypothetical protein GCG54_00015271 [Colletotrichum gloeosporioides]|uniref:Uncharacterized protein n=1 Tax=Colletotrichum gloeosporioides TaxID=474922 RepID=A0A8H4FDX0_COLGL|nr:uncharacterized protein GCG54_00015271 [Colletotrichum gloeosporioides]KAF3798290.1 hypothetical protein GCG54_00015271 [Colletotrichum gloeosporioides]